MKRSVMMGMASICIAMLPAAGCNWDDSEPAKESSAKLVFSVAVTRSGVPDTDDFILEVSSASGDSCYCGRFGDRPEEMSVKPGEYEVSFYSEFDGPAFDAPQYGDKVNVTVKKRETATVTLNCSLVNSGLSLGFTDEFVKEYGPSPILLSQGGKEVEYPFSKSPVAYFNPGKVFFLHEGEVILYKELEKGQIRHLSLDAVCNSSDLGFHISINTDIPVVDESQEVEQSAFTVQEIKGFDDGLVVSVEGYVAGGVKNSKFIEAGSPGYDITSNIVMAGSATGGSLATGIPVELKGSSKESLNLADHPDLAGRKIIVRGTVMPYFGMKGIKGVTSFSICE